MTNLSQQKGTRMALKFAAYVSTAETDYGTVLLDERAGEYWELNPTGSLVVDTLMRGGDEAAAVAALADEFDIDLARAKQDVETLVKELRASGLAK
ncbi:lasso peptide biosynthesis PqqD family chaperone [Streptomyces pseudovenezuelae]|uniref:lasso peptide biosynthesis PqqD family chaperone n=1 Tax=Streptomyces pseudovenezuelae TaxID=67350 RepID=UPI0036E35BC2